MSHHVFYQMMSFLRLSDSRAFNLYSSSTEWADKDKMSSSALSEADVEGPAVAGSAHFNGLKKEDIEEGPAVAGSADFLINLDTFLYVMSHFATPGRIWVTFLQGLESFFNTTKTFSKSFDVQAMHRFFFLFSLFCVL
ncbi:hypothetical protein E2C01_062469 [Portunus trituberculatus]|uniref:Uncharacterized protein n=1 Tax=Portunus trituberculatus TaxID=210409 RepID=A0A5B7H6I7_PORTR|nr:hypothetical protein [Portunus trituberculatus]